MNFPNAISLNINKSKAESYENDTFDQTYIMKPLYAFVALFISLNSFCQTLGTVESVEYDHANQRFLVSNANSIIAMSHPDLELSFFGSGQASYGMEIMNNTLFVIHNGIKAYDLDTEEEVMSHSIAGAGFLNGMASDGNGRLWVTDFSNNRIYEVDATDLGNPSHEIVVSNTGTTPNGIVYDDINDRLVFVSWGNNAPIKEVSLPDYDVTTLTSTSLGFCDGIDNDAQNNFFVSSWSPTRISRFDPTFTQTPEIIEAPGINSPADICYGQAIDTLAIPNSGNSTVTFVDFGSTTGLEEANEIADFRILGNPVSEETRFKFELKSAAIVELRIVDINGREIESLISGNRSPGNYTVLLNGIELSAGSYLVQLRVNENQVSKKILVQ